MDFEKLQKVVLSCKTLEQLYNATNYVELFARKYHYSPYCCGKAMGLLYGMRKGLFGI